MSTLNDWIVFHIIHWSSVISVLRCHDAAPSLHTCKCIWCRRTSTVRLASSDASCYKHRQTDYWRRNISVLFVTHALVDAFQIRQKWRVDRTFWPSIRHIQKLRRCQWLRHCTRCNHLPCCTCMCNVSFLSSFNAHKITAVTSHPCYDTVTLNPNNETELHVIAVVL